MKEICVFVVSSYLNTNIQRVKFILPALKFATSVYKILIDCRESLFFPIASIFIRLVWYAHNSMHIALICFYSFSQTFILCHGSHVESIMVGRFFSFNFDFDVNWKLDDCSFVLVFARPSKYFKNSILIN